MARKLHSILEFSPGGRQRRTAERERGRAPTQAHRLPWGDGEKELRIPTERITAEISFTDLPPVEDPAAALRQAMDAPIGTAPLRQLVKPGDRVALLTGDRITDRMLGSRDGLGHVVLDYLNAAGVRDQDVTLVEIGRLPLRDVLHHRVLATEVAERIANRLETVRTEECRGRRQRSNQQEWP